MITVDVGETVTLEQQFTDAAGALADPDDVSLEFTDPSGNTTDVAQVGLTATATGVWTYALTVDEAGLWTGTWTGTGVNGTVSAFAVLVGVRTEGPCQPWTDPGHVDSLHDDASDLNQGKLATMCVAASELIYDLSGRRYAGVCRDTVRPCARRSYESVPWDDQAWSGSTAWRGRPVVACGCQTGPACGCGTLDEITLGGWPLRKVERVRVDGQVLVRGTHWRVDDRARLVRIDGQGWPCCQRLDLAPTEDDTFEVVFWYGTPPPESGRLAAATLAYELTLAAAGSESCRLPPNVQNYTRQGVTVVLNDPQAIRDGVMGIPEIDFFLAAKNPNRLRRRAGVLSPDLPRRVRRTSTEFGP